MAWDSNWESIFSTRPWGKYPGEDVIRFVARNFYKSPDRSAIKLLEVGCGTGANIWYMAREGFSVFGVDGSKTAVSLCEQRLSEEVSGWSGEIVQGDILNLPFEDGTFDGVLDVEAISCNAFEDSVQIYREMARVLKPHGKLYTRCFATGTHGEGTGKQVGYRGSYPDEGPMAGMGFLRLTAKGDLPNLLAPFTIDEVDLIVRGETMNEPIREWCVTATKTQ
ncbi:class I SAM-dependent methyltransferase [Salinispirillum marinum]|uniref:Class I SAM-dependent methyltransferase n=2 Tax=Saccharospirillaceae TaxID=255527 RepID=A0ABV8BHI9_9GAMM